MPTSNELVDRRLRLVSRVEQENISLGPAAHKQPIGPGVLLVVVNPVGAMRLTNPANVAAFRGSRLLWSVPLDFRRLGLEPSTPETEHLFASFWQEVDRTLEAPGETAVVWAAATEVGRPPAAWGHVPGWVEYREPRPWVSIGSQADGLVIAVPLNEPDEVKSPQRYPAGSEEHDRPWHVRVRAGCFTPSIPARMLRKRDSMAELAHFAIIEPDTEHWTRDGMIDATCVSVLRGQQANWAQRGTDGRVCIC
jgi:hypothetical protein